MAFWMYCDCGGQMHPALGEHITGRYRSPAFLGDRKGQRVRMNQCVECGKLWPAPRVPRRQADVNQGARP